MNRPIPPTRRAALAVVLTLLAAASSARADSPESTAAAPSPAPSGPEQTHSHTLFMGVELAVQRDERLLPVRDVQGAYLIAKHKGKEIRIPTTGRSLNMKVTRALKVSQRSAMLEKVKVDRAYTPARDPFKKFVAASGAAGGADAVASLAQGQMTTAILNQDFASVAASRGYGSSDGDAQIVQASTTAFANAVGMAESYNLSMGDQANRMSGELAEEGFDALEISFRIASPTPLAQPFVVILAQLRAGEAKKATQYNWVYAKALDPIEEKPSSVYIKQGGFPAGFVIEQCTIHLFNHGEEVPTNHALMRVAMSKDEAFEFATIDYVTKNKDATLPAGLALGQNTDALRRHLADHYQGGPVFVQVGADGRPSRAFADKGASEEVRDEVLLTILRELRFQPALSKGKPVESVVPVKASAERA